MKRLLLIAMVALLAGCVIDHRKSEPASFTPHSKNATADLFVGTYQNQAFDHASRAQATLAEYEFGYWQPGIKDVDSVSIYIDREGDLSFIGLKDGKEKFRTTYKKADGYSFSGREIRFRSSSYATSPDTMTAGRQSHKSSVSLAEKNALVYSTTSGFSGLAYGIVPASTSHERVSIFERIKTEPNQSLQTTTMAVTDAAAQPPRQP